MKYRDIKPTTPPEPAGVVVLKPEHWNVSYSARPLSEVAVGLRLLTHPELTTAHAEASREADERDRAGEARAFRFREALVCWTLASALCDPNDATAPYFQRGDEEVREAFPPETLRHLWHELERVQVAASPVRRGLVGDDAAQLAAALTAGDLDRLPEGRRARVSRLLRFCLEEIISSR